MFKKILLTQKEQMRRTIMRDYRVRKENAEKLIQELTQAGYKAEYSKCEPKTSWGEGCSDPDCCLQHPEAIIYTIKGMKFARMPDTWCAVKTNASSNTVHKLLQETYNKEKDQDND